MSKCDHVFDNGDMRYESYCGKCQKYETETVISDLKAQIERLKSAHRWIPVSEALPESDYECLVVVPIDDDLDIGICWYDDGTAYADTSAGWRDGAFIRVVTHWMPLPEPPEGCEE